MIINSLAGKPAQQPNLVNVPRMVAAYYTGKPDPRVLSQRVAFGTSGHRGSSLTNSFNENHILAIIQAICFFRREQKIDGPLYLGFDTHALSAPAFATAMEVLAANNVAVIIAIADEYTPTPVISHAIVKYNTGRKSGLADGIVITPSHNPPDYGGLKYNSSNGGPAAAWVTNWIENKANALLQNNLKTTKRITYQKALKAATTHRQDYLNVYINDLVSVIDMDAIRNSEIKMGVDPLGGAGVHYWQPIAERYKINLTVVNKIVDPAFGFMTLDWDGQIRMDPSSSFAMQRMIGMKDNYDISFACDTDHDRHGIVTRSAGLMKPNHYLCAAVSYLLQNRPLWNKKAAVGKTVVTTQLINRIALKLGRTLYDVPVGFKWFAEGLMNSSLCFAGEESAGASFSRIDGRVWTTDKDGIISALLAAEITAKTGNDPGRLYSDLIKEFGEPFYDRIEAKVAREQKEKLSKLSPDSIKQKDLAGEKIINLLTQAPGNGASIGGLKVCTKNGWFAARPSGTEDIYKIYAESFLSKIHLQEIIDQAQSIINTVLSIK